MPTSGGIAQHAVSPPLATGNDLQGSPFALGGSVVIEPEPTIAQPPDYQSASKNLQKASESPLLIGPAGAPIEGAAQSAVTALGGGQARVRGSGGPDGESAGWIRVMEPNTGQVIEHSESYSDGNLTVGTSIGHHDNQTGQFEPDYIKAYDPATRYSWEKTFNRDADGNVTSITLRESINGIPISESSSPGQLSGNPDLPITVGANQQTIAPERQVASPSLRDTPDSLMQPERIIPNASDSSSTLTAKIAAPSSSSVPSSPDEKLPDERMERFSSPPWEWRPSQLQFLTSQSPSQSAVSRDLPVATLSFSDWVSDWMTRGGANILTGGMTTAFGLAGIFFLADAPITLPVVVIGSMLSTATGIPILTVGAIQLASSGSMSDAQQREINRGTSFLGDLGGPVGLLSSVAGGIVGGEKGAELWASKGAMSDKLIDIGDTIKSVIEGEASWGFLGAKATWNAIDQSKIVNPDRYKRE
jgi:hypothetical protein